MEYIEAKLYEEQELPDFVPSRNIFHFDSVHVLGALYAGPSVWNNLPQTLCHSDSTSSFKAALKTHLFNNYF